MTRLADHRPPYCSSCFQSKDCRFVDFEAAYDGPVIPGTPTPVPIDDLIICEDCLRTAFGLIDPQNLKDTIASLEQIVRDLSEEVADKDKAIQGAKATINELVEHPVASFPGKPVLVGVSDDVRKLITQRRYERNGTTPDPTQKKDK